MSLLESWLPFIFIAMPFVIALVYFETSYLLLKRKIYSPLVEGIWIGIVLVGILFFIHISADKSGEAGILANPLFVVVGLLLFGPAAAVGAIYQGRKRSLFRSEGAETITSQ